MNKYLFVSIITVLLLLQSCIVLAATEITGTITAKRGDLVKVDFQPNKSAGPKVGDEVKFSYILSGFPVSAGTGKVTEVDGNTVWIKPAKNNLKLKMKAVIHATGLAKRKKTIQSNNAPPQHLCDELAAHPWDFQHIGPALKFSSINANQAIDACKDAVNEYPKTPRFLFQLGRAYDANKQYHDAFKYYQQAAEYNYVAAQYHIGAMHFHGRSVSPDHVEAFKWVRKAAVQGHAVAQFSVGWSYHYGKGVSEDDVEAVKWYRKAADQGHDLAQSNLGVMFQDGDGVNQDYTEAAKWYRKAAVQGLDYAQYNLAVLYTHGWGVQESMQEAIRWLKKAASQGHEKAEEQLSELGY